MPTVPLGLSPPPKTSILTISKKKLTFPHKPSTHHPSLFPLPITGGRVCRASEVVELFPAVGNEIMVREARLEDCWEVAETHCSCFFPNYSFPFDLMLRMNRVVGMVSGFSSLPTGCKRTCLVAVIGNSHGESFVFGNEDFRIGGLDVRFSLINKGYIAGILTVDTVADFLPRKGPFQQRRTGVAYISNVAVMEGFRQKGIAKRLIAKAEMKASSWGCRSIALHCDAKNPAATRLYIGQGYKCVQIPQGANWPLPKTGNKVKFNFMMKLLKQPNTMP
ncbi:uncharacterized protein LOC124945033 [Impatiens glandulifera]|uniref:uncharacterized protein LOC124945033 n=1 Tax=Impatiens glandulifera TaxID=253017 RepID=UPI001FB12F46|nr:uncharacterized protein LOC124945033 [Impatiens glandulifera]